MNQVKMQNVLSSVLFFIVGIMLMLDAITNEQFVCKWGFVIAFASFGFMALNYGGEL